MDIMVCVASGAANAKLVMDKIASGEADWTFVEIMGCPGGCVNGGGQPIQPQSVRDTVDLKAERAKALYDQDAKMVMRKSHKNPIVKEVYENYFKGEWGCHAAHEALHTTYVKRQK
jgi:NADP-reducing hydrogenase subunit HndD